MAKRLLPLLIILLAGCPVNWALGTLSDGHEELGWEAESDHGCHQCWQGKLLRARLASSYDADTGRDLRNFPPDRHVDYEHMRLSMRFEDLNERRFTAEETLSFHSLRDGVETIQLDAVGLDIESVHTENGLEVTPYHDGEVLTVRFAEALKRDQKVTLVMRYVCDRPLTGLFFTPSSDEAPHYTAEVHTQGQSIDNRHWFISHDSPNERLSTELVVDVPKRFSVSSNGRLVSKTNNGDRSVWHYLQERPHVSYLVSLIIGEFDIVPLDHPRVPMQVWVQKGQASWVQGTYGRTGAMIDLFEELFDEPYPWDRYDQLCVKNFGSGGMENTTVTTLYASAVFDDATLKDRDLDGLIAHELAHQWFGDLLTCKEWAHLWINEGWATYSSALWNEKRFGHDAYLDSIRGSYGVARRDKTTGEIPMVSGIYDHPDETFSRAANPYPKGSSVLHMLRCLLGDDVFWRGVRLFVDRYRDTVVETSDFRQVLEEVSGLSLEWFFDQWCYRPGCPELDVNLTYDAASKELKAQVNQTQKIDAVTPAFRFTLPLFVRTGAGDSVHRIEVRDRETSFQVRLEAPPSLVAVDPELWVLKTMTVTKPEAWWKTQARFGPSIAARHRALNSLGSIDSPESIEILMSVIEDKDTRYTLRRTALRALGGFGSDQAREKILALAEASLDEPRVRNESIRQLSPFDDEQVLPLLMRTAEQDSSPAVRSTAIFALGQRKAKSALPLLEKLVKTESQGDRIRTASLSAMADLDASEGLSYAIEYSGFGHSDRSRPSAIRVLGRLAHHDSDRALAHLVALLQDPESRAVRSAAAALAATGDKRALDPLKRMRDTHRDPNLRRRAENYVKTLEGREDDS